jgi:hypothetical protein
VEEQEKPTGTLKEGFRCGNPAQAPFMDLDDFYKRGQLVHLEEFLVYERTESVSRVLVPVNKPDYKRASVEEAFGALALTPDPDFIVKLFLADHVHPMAPWIQQTEGAEILSESSDDGSVLLYRPLSTNIQASIIYEWCNLLRLYNSNSAELFKFTLTLEDFVDLETGKTVQDERLVWNLLGCLLLQQPEEIVFSLCTRFPLKAAIFGRTLLKAMLAVCDFRQNDRYDFFVEKAKFIDFSASKVGLDALKKLPDRNDSIERLIEFLAEQDLLKSLNKD